MIFGRELSPEAMCLIADSLQDMPLAALKEASVRAIRECLAFPAVAELRRLAGVRQPDPDADGRQAWEALLAFLRRHGPDLRSPETGRLCESRQHTTVARLPEIVWRAAQRAGGLTRCWWGTQGNEEDLQWMKKDFLAEYRALGGCNRLGLPEATDSRVLALADSVGRVQ